jgi:hypothetical protein
MPVLLLFLFSRVSPPVLSFVVVVVVVCIASGAVVAAT